MNTRAVLTRIVLYILLSFFVFVFLLPFWACIMTSLKTDAEYLTTAPIEPPSSLTLVPWVRAFIGWDGVVGMERPLVISFTFTAFATIFSCIIGSINGYVFSKMRFKGSNILFLFFSVGIFIPYQSVLIPLVLTMARLGLYNNVVALILTHTVYGIPICTLLFRNFYKEVPDSLVMAAKTEGAGTWRIYRSIILPLSVSMFVVAGVFQFTSIWNDFLFGLVLLSGSNVPASVALANLNGTTTVLKNTLMAGTVWFALPVIIVYLVLGRYLIRGYMAGAVKG